MWVVNAPGPWLPSGSLLRDAGPWSAQRRPGAPAGQSGAPIWCHVVLLELCSFTSVLGLALRFFSIASEILTVQNL